MARLRAGAAWLIVSLLLLAVAAFFTYASVQGPVADGLAIGSGAAWVTGAWLLTTVDPSGLGEDRYRRCRRTTRWTAAGVAGGLGWATAHQLVGPAVLRSPNVFVAAWLLLVAAHVWAVLSYVDRLAGRMTDGGMVGFAGVLTWWLGRPLTATAGWLVVAVNFDDATGHRGTPLGVVPACGMCVCGLPLIVGGPALILLVSRLVSELSDDLRAGRERWRR